MPCKIYLWYTGTKEAAFIHAVTAAGVVHAVTQSCSAGNLTDCSCDMSRAEGKDSDGAWKWGGCSDNIKYGIWFAQTFVDAPEEQRYTVSPDVRALVNLHNNKAGRKVRVVNHFDWFAGIGFLFSVPNFSLGQWCNVCT